MKIAGRLLWTGGLSQSERTDYIFLYCPVGFNLSSTSSSTDSESERVVVKYPIDVCATSRFLMR